MAADEVAVTNNGAAEPTFVGSNERRWMGIGGLIFVALAIVLIAVAPNTPAVHASSATLTSFYTKSKQARFALGGFIIMAMIVVGVFWFWYFRDLLASAASARRLATVGFAGAVLFAVSGGLGAGLNFVMSDAAGHASLSTIEVLNYFQSELNLGLGAAGVVLFLVATGLAVIRFRILPVWLGWLAIAFAAVTFLITPFNLLSMGVWMIPTNIVIIMRSNAQTDRIAATRA